MRLTRHNEGLCGALSSFQSLAEFVGCLQTVGDNYVIIKLLRVVVAFNGYVIWMVNSISFTIAGRFAGVYLYQDDGKKL